ncbi:cell division protein SepF [Blastococcus sp. TF02A-30]|uniref:cell division protein SepF n=1 Tax=Blastococcus sp. TF02A-30 TaxID=2250580 RepID=UPI000DE8CBCF|nr:cell division protein SepF [Blastococcus sp. TF02A-30]RBY85588.1 cell division protein [Blastococcus sp. TF02A-30]
MAGAMRRMGIYLGLVEDDDARGYGRYDARQSDLEHDRRYGRYAEDRYDDYADGEYAGYDDEELEAAEPAPAPVRDPEPISVRRVTPARPIGLASSGPSGSSGSRISAMSSGPVGAAGLAVREPVVAVAPEPAPAPAPAPQPYRITTLHPRTYNEARTIGERFRDGMPVIMNLTEMDDADAKRLVDFAAGLSFGLRGSIERVTAKVFLLSPQNVDVTAEDKARIREGGFFNQS